MNGRFGSLLTAMVTPFDPDGKLNLVEAERLADWLIRNGSDGLVVSGSTGEASTLSDQEKMDLWRAVKGAAGGTPVIAGTGSNDTAHSCALSRIAEGTLVDGVLAVTPYYNRPSQTGLIAHFRAIASSTSLPVILYDIPSRSVTKIEHRTIMELAEVDNIVGIKDACGSAQGAARIAAEAPGDFELFSGNDGDTLPWLAVGAVGVIAVASHLVGPQMADMIRLFKQGDPAAARKIHFDLMPVYDVMSITTNPVPVKAALAMMGRPAGDPRLPLVPATGEEKKRISEVLERAGLL